MKTLYCTFNPILEEYTDEDHEHSYLNTKMTRRPVQPAKQYAYLYTGSREVKVGDHAVVHNGSEFSVVRIERVKPGIDDKVVKHVLSVVTRDDFQQYLVANKAIVDHRTVFDQLDHLLEEDAKMQKYRDLAKNNPQAQELLNKIGVWHGPVIECHMSAPTYDVPKEPSKPNEA